MKKNIRLENRILTLKPGDVIEVYSKNILKDRADAYRFAGRAGFKISARVMFNAKGFEIARNGGAK